MTSGNSVVLKLRKLTAPEERGKVYHQKKNFFFRKNEFSVTTSYSSWYVLLVCSFDSFISTNRMIH